MQNYEAIPVSVLAAALARVDPDAPVFVEVEGRRLLVTACMPSPGRVVLRAEAPLDDEAEEELAQGTRL